MLRTLYKKIMKDDTRKSSAINFALKPISVILGLVYTPLLLTYLGDLQYGLWSTILSIISWVNYCDVGVGNGLRNVLAKALSLKDFEKAKKAISTAYIVLTGISSFLLLISMILLFSLDWHSIFNTDIDMRMPLGISFAFICMNFVLALSNTIFYSIQSSHSVAIRHCIIQFLNIVGILFLIKYTHSSLVLISILFGSTTAVIYISNTIMLVKKYNYMRIAFVLFDKTTVSGIANLGIRFFIIQIACLALYTVDNLLITNMFGGEAVTPYNIAYRVFFTAYAFLNALCIPYWSKTTDAMAKRDILWIKNANSHLSHVSFLFIVFFIALSMMFKTITHIWLGRDLDYPNGLIPLMCIYYCLYTIVTVKSKVINGTGYINFQMVLMVTIGSLNIPLSILLAKNCGMGVVGVKMATTILMLVAAIAYSFNLHQIVKKLEQSWCKPVEKF
jgi:O-antigen/teichoic acid export membrane protein